MNAQDSMSPNKLTEGTLANMRMANRALAGLALLTYSFCLAKNH